MAQLGDSGLRSFMRLQSRCQLGYPSSEGLTGIKGSKLAHSHGWWREASVPYHVELSIGLLKTWKLASVRASDPREGQGCGCDVSDDPPLEVILHHYPQYHYHTGQDYSAWEGNHRKAGIQSGDNWGPSWRPTALLLKMNGFFQIDKGEEIEESISVRGSNR